MKRLTRISVSSRPVRATLALAATAMLAACGGGGSDTDSPLTATTSAALASPSSEAATAAVTPVNAPLIADQGAIAPEAMDADTQAALRAEAADAKPVASAGTPKPEHVDATLATQTSAPAAASAMQPDTAATRSGGRAVPLPAVATAPAPSPVVSSPTPTTGLTGTSTGKTGTTNTGTSTTATGPTGTTTAGTTPTTATTSTTSTTTTTSGGALPVQPVSSTDIRLQVSADQLFSSYRWLWGMECAGQVQGAINIPETGLQGFDLGGSLGTQRFGKVADPDDASRRVLMFRPNAGDPLIYGGPRCEMTFSPSFGGKLPVKQDVWFAFGMRFQDWTSTTDEQVLMQWHWSNGSIPVGPFLALAMKAGKLQIDSKANAAYPPSPTTTKSTVHWTGEVTPNSWSYFVVKARISPNMADAPYLQVWRDGVQIVNHQGPFGYNYPEVTPYVKIGHYQWLAGNTWSSTARTKTILVRTPALINDTTGKYTEADIRGHVKAR